MSNIGPHYARTLREWRRRFVERFEDVVGPALREEYPEVMAGENGAREVEVFRRKWVCECWLRIRIAFFRFLTWFGWLNRLLVSGRIVGITLGAVVLTRYLACSCYCEVGFTTRTLGGE